MRMDHANLSATQTHDDRRILSFASRILPAALVLALLTVLIGVAVLVGRIASAPQALIHTFTVGGAAVVLGVRTLSCPGL